MVCQSRSMITTIVSWKRALKGIHAGRDQDELPTRAGQRPDKDTLYTFTPDAAEDEVPTRAGQGPDSSGTAVINLRPLPPQARASSGFHGARGSTTPLRRPASR